MRIIPVQKSMRAGSLLVLPMNVAFAVVDIAEEGSAESNIYAHIVTLLQDMKEMLEMLGNGSGRTLGSI